jgi:hypothetical protein
MDDSADVTKPKKNRFFKYRREEAVDDSADVTKPKKNPSLDGPDIQVQHIRKVALKNNYFEVGINKQSKVVSFKCENCQIDIFYFFGLVRIHLYHPVVGETQVFRQIETLEDLSNIFKSHRSHTSDYVGKVTAKYLESIID